MNSALCARRCFKCQPSVLCEIWHQKLSWIFNEDSWDIYTPWYFLIFWINWENRESETVYKIYMLDIFKISR